MSKSAGKRNILCRFVAALLVVLLCAVWAAPAVAAASETSGKLDGMRWSYSGGVLSVSGRAIPDFTELNPAPWHQYRAEIRRLDLADSLTAIGAMAFYDCSAITAVELPRKVKTVGAMAFAGCSAMTTITMPRVTALGDYAFSRCFALENAVLPDGLTHMGSAVFYRCQSLKTVTVPATVTEMGGSVFAYCSGLLQAHIAAPIALLPEWTFYGCEKLSELTLSDTMTAIGEDAFTRCEVLVTVYHNGTDNDELVQDILDALPGLSTESITPTPEDVPPVKDFVYEKEDGKMWGTESTLTSGGGAVVQTDTVIAYPLVGENGYSEEKDEARIDITATITEKEGWDKLTAAIEEQIFHQGVLKDETDKQVPMTVSVSILDGSLLYGKTLQALAGKQIVLNLRTPNGSCWSIDCSLLRGYQFSKSYDMEYTLTRYENPSAADKRVIGEAVSYRLAFADKINFPSTVQLYIDPTATQQVASLYEKAFMSDLKRLQSVTVGDDGVAPYCIGNVNKGARYVVALNVSGITTEDVILSPQTPADEEWLENYVPVTDQYIITDVRGFMGMTMKQFTITVVCVVCALALVVFIVALVINMMGKKKAMEEYRNSDEQ